MRDRAYARGKAFTWLRTVRELEAVLYDVVARKRDWDAEWAECWAVWWGGGEGL